jgi:hypothetical protein
MLSGERSAPEKICLRRAAIDITKSCAMKARNAEKNIRQRKNDKIPA